MNFSLILVAWGREMVSKILEIVKSISLTEDLVLEMQFETFLQQKK